MARDPKHLGEAELAAMVRRFAPTRLSANASHLPESERRALAKVVAAAALLDDLFLHQVWEGNPALLESLRADDSALGRTRLRYFVLNKGPWSRVDDNHPFIPGVPEPKPAGAGFYPPEMTKAEFEAWVSGLSEQERAVALGLYHVVRREASGELRAVPYARVYRPFLLPATVLLRQAAELTLDQLLRRFLTSRADALLSDDFFDSDVAWMELTSDLDVTFGPYETYEDELLGLKTSYEAYVGIVDRAATEQLARFSGLLQEIENNLPLEQRYRNRDLPRAAPIRVIDLVYAAGDGNRGPQTAAFNLPNDERITASKGFKRVMLKNVQSAKFEKVLLPIAGLAMPRGRQAEVSFDVFFTSVLLHELAHGLGPQTAQVGGRSVTLR
ncbi:MAG: dipeptidyl-peptidase 3 family protein, partial [Chloroflexota bacterium]